MALQAFVNKEYAPGVAGDMVNPGEGQNVFTPVNPIADGDVNVGSFVFPGSDPYAQASNAAAVDTAGTDTYAVAAGSVASGNLSVINDGVDVVVQTTVGSFNNAAGTLTIPVGSDFTGDITIGGVKVASVAAGGAVTAGTLTGTGTASSFAVSKTEYVGDNIVVTMTVTWTGSSTGAKVMGFVVRDQMYPNYKLDSSGTLTVPAGFGLNVAVKGAFYAVAKTDATIGQAVFASTADGSISTDSAGETVASHVETDFVVKRGGSAGELIVIGNV